MPLIIKQYMQSHLKSNKRSWLLFKQLVKFRLFLKTLTFCSWNSDFFSEFWQKCQNVNSDFFFWDKSQNSELFIFIIYTFFPVALIVFCSCILLLYQLVELKFSSFAPLPGPLYFSLSPLIPREFSLSRPCISSLPSSSLLPPPSSPPLASDLPLVVTRLGSARFPRLCFTPTITEGDGISICVIGAD